MHEVTIGRGISVETARIRCTAGQVGHVGFQSTISIAWHRVAICQRLAPSISITRTCIEIVAVTVSVIESALQVSPAIRWSAGVLNFGAAIFRYIQRGFVGAQAHEVFAYRPIRVTLKTAMPFSISEYCVFTPSRVFPSYVVGKPEFDPPLLAQPAKTSAAPAIKVSVLVFILRPLIILKGPVATQADHAT